MCHSNLTVALPNSFEGAKPSLVVRYLALNNSISLAFYNFAPSSFLESGSLVLAHRADGMKPQPAVLCGLKGDI